MPTRTLPCYVAVGADRIAWSSADAATWTSAPMPKLAEVALATDGQQVVAVGGRKITVTKDGTTWSVPQRVGASLNAVAYGNGRWVAVGDDGALLTSTDAAGWQHVAPATSEDLLAVATSGTQWVAVGGTAILTSSDALSWHVAVTRHELLGVATNGTSWVVVGQDTVATSADGRRFHFEHQVWNFGVVSDPWENNGFTFPPPDPPHVSASPSVWVAWGLDSWGDPGSVFAQSLDGRSWSSIEGWATRPTNVPSALSWDGTRWVALVTTWHPPTTTSPGSTGWEIRTATTDATDAALLPRLADWTVTATDASGDVPSALVATCGG
ncbi:MAG: hypothetical protein U0W40_12905 [Acidimicrobiia bacterium]